MSGLGDPISRATAGNLLLRVGSLLGDGTSPNDIGPHNITLPATADWQDLRASGLTDPYGKIVVEALQSLAKI